MTVSFSFPDPAKRLNLNDRLFWRERAARTQAWRYAAWAHGFNYREAGAAWEPAPSNVLITFEVPDPGRRRDPHNMIPTVKAIVDGLVDAYYWPDDNAEWVTVIDPQFRKGAARVQVDITPRSDHA